MAEEELVTKISIDIDDKSVSALKEAEDAPKRIVKSVEGMGKSQKKTTAEEKQFHKELSLLNKEFISSSKLMGGIDKSLGYLRGGFLGVGAAVGVAAGGGALYKFGEAVAEAAKSGVDLSNASFSLQMSPEDIQIMGQAYEQLGGKIENFYADAQRYREMMREPFDASAIENLHNKLKGMSEMEAVAFMRINGFSDDVTRIAMQHGENFGKLADGIREAGNALSQDQIDRFKEFNAASVELVATLGHLGDSLLAGSSSWLAGELNNINNSLLGFTGNISSLENLINRFNGKTLEENLASGNPETAAKAISEAVDNLRGQDRFFTGQEGKDKLDAEYVKAEKEYERMLIAEFGEEGYRKLREDAERNGRRLTEGNYSLGRNKGELGGVTNRGLFNEYSKHSEFYRPRALDEGEESDGNSMNAAVDAMLANPILGGGRFADPPAYADSFMPPPEEDAPSIWDRLFGLFWGDEDENPSVQLPASPADIESYGANPQSPSTTTNSVHVEQYITAPDPVTAGNEAAGRIGDIMGQQANVTTMTPGWW